MNQLKKQIQRICTDPETAGRRKGGGVEWAARSDFLCFQDLFCNLACVPVEIFANISNFYMRVLRVLRYSVISHHIKAAGQASVCAKIFVVSPT